VTDIDEAPYANAPSRTWPREPTSLWRTPPRWLFHALLVVPALAFLWNASLPGNDLGVWVVAALFSIAAAAVWTLRLVAFAVTVRRLSFWFIVAPVLAGLLLAVDATSLPLKARFALSESAFTHAATSYSADVDTSQRIGSYEIWSVTQDGDVLLFSESHGCDLMCDAGFVYAPYGFRSSDESSEPDLHLEHLTGPWWTYWTEE
jgi:hypothetical protein